MEFSKYIILMWQGREQAVTFPKSVQHVDVFRYIREQNPGIKAVAAGMFHDNPWWHGGESLTLGIQSRPQDAHHIQAMLKSPDRRLWDLRVLVWEACEASRRREMTVRSPEISLN
jgi:hypothetical protein